ncbi:MAG TPA: RNA polymerase sigma factor [Patescibacteria group bacterium]|nr:RNA polymerase sigma factor [Patescibacteria group bacterium]
MKIVEKKLLFDVKVRKDQEAFGRLYDLYVEKIYRFVFFKIQNKEETEDITSDIFLKAWTYLLENPSREVHSFSGLVYRIARNAVVDYYRSKVKNKEQALETAEALGEIDIRYANFEIDQEMEKVLAHLKRLKQEYQEVLMLRYVEDLEISEIAEIINKSKTNVRVILFRAIRKLKEIMK